MPNTASHNALRSKWTPERDALLRKMMAEGHSQKVIAHRLGVGKGAVGHRWMKLRQFDAGEIKVLTNHIYNAFTPAEDAVILSRRAAGASWNGIGRKLQRTGGSIAARYKFLSAADDRPAAPIVALRPWPGGERFDGKRDHAGCLAVYARFSADLRYSMAPAFGRSMSGNAAALCVTG